MMPDLSTITTAHTALREATATMRSGRRATRDPATRDGVPCTGPAYALLGADAANTLEALAALLRSTEVDPIPTSPVGHSFLALLQQVVYSATLARRIAGADRDDDPVMPPGRRNPAPAHRRPAGDRDDGSPGVGVPAAGRHA
ncbi:MAG TPA: hypothetical protein VGH76_19315 [Actinomycetospora sp.]|jgi:hypothetical protein|uniref:hypothetical protein n=1 Tax=Actinomycetospora sp. TaxID=1872135 RepID=UPI002F42D84B